MWCLELDDLTRAIIKARYESIGLTFQIEICRELINFLVDNGISYRNIQFRYFLRCQDVMKATSTSLSFSTSRACRNKVVLATLPLITAFLIFGAILGSMWLAPVSVHSVTFIFFTMIYTGIWLIVSHLALDEWKKMTA